MTSTPHHFLIKDAAAAKAGAHSSGAVLYRLLTDSDRSDLYLAITGNQGGSGYFSREAVPFAKVRQCVSDLPDGKPLASKTFKAAFVGRSTNNAGFLAAILRAEGLLAPAPDSLHQHLLHGDWAAWQSQQLALPATPLPTPSAAAAPTSAAAPVAEAITDTEESALADRLKSRKARRSAGTQPQHPTTAGQGGDADVD